MDVTTTPSTTRVRRLALAVTTLAAALALASPAAAAETSEPSLDRSNWPTICVNSNYETGRTYEATPRSKANCRELTVGSDRRTRRFVAVVPDEALDREGRTPVVFMLHGSTGTGEQFWNNSRWREMAQQEGFIAVFPSGLSYRLTTGRNSTKWNSIGFRECEAARTARPADDVAFLDAILRDLRRQIPNIDNRRIYVAGFSNGSQMATTLALTRGDVYAAVGGMAGGLPTQRDGCRYTVPDSDAIAPMWFTIGGLDDRWGAVDNPAPQPDVTLPTDVNRMEVYFNQFLTTQLRALQVERTRTGTVSIDSLVTQRSFDPTITPTWSQVIQYEDARPGNGSDNYVLFDVLADVPHKYPNSWLTASPHQVRTSQDVALALLHWQWFLDNPMPRGGR